MSVANCVCEALRFKSRRWFIAELLVVAFGLGFALLGGAALLSDIPSELDPPATWLSIVLIVPLLTVPLVRRRWPLTALTIATALVLVVRIIEVPELQVSGIAWLITIFGVGRYGKRPSRTISRAVAVASGMGLLLLEFVTAWDEIDVFDVSRDTFVLIATSQVLFNVALFSAAWFGGDLARKRAGRERELAARTLELEASREENARRAVMDERVRIAREIHDVVAHHVSVMGVQAGAARRAAMVDPDQVQAPLQAIEESSREAVQELHRLLGFLRRVDEVDPDGLSPDAISPRPGLTRLPGLRRQLADAGLAVRLRVTGQERPLPASVDLSAFRILQEALTNCLKYAGVDHAEVDVCYAADRLSIAVRDRGRGPAAAPAPTGSGGGAGLAGMAERVALLGGILRHGERLGGGFEVVTELPFAGEVSAAPSAMPATVPTSDIEASLTQGAIS